MLCPEGIAEKALGGLGIAGCTQQKVNGMALSIDSPVEVIPRVLDVDAGLIEPVCIMRTVSFSVLCSSSSYLRITFNLSA